MSSHGWANETRWWQPKRKQIRELCGMGCSFHLISFILSFCVLLISYSLLPWIRITMLSKKKKRINRIEYIKTETDSSSHTGLHETNWPKYPDKRDDVLLFHSFFSPDLLVLSLGSVIFLNNILVLHRANTNRRSHKDASSQGNNVRTALTLQNNNAIQRQILSH